MSDLSSLAMGDDVDQEETDFLGGFQVKESGLYPMEIDLAYMGLSRNGAKTLNLVFKKGREELRQTIYVTNNKAKGQLPYYLDKATKVKRPLPGMSLANAIAELTVGKKMSDLKIEEKLIKLYDFEKSKEVDTKVDVIMDLLGEEVILGLRKQIVDKNVKNDSGEYVPSGETREENEIVKVFRSGDKKSIAEARSGAPADFIDKWSAKNTGVTINKAKGNANSGVSTGAPADTTDSATLF